MRPEPPQRTAVDHVTAPVSERLSEPVGVNAFEAQLKDLRRLRRRVHPN